MILKLALVLAASLRARATSSSFYIPYHNIYIDTIVLATRRRNKTLRTKPASLFHSYGTTAAYNPITCLQLTPGRSNIWAHNLMHVLDLFLQWFKFHLYFGSYLGQPNPTRAKRIKDRWPVTGSYHLPYATLINLPFPSWFPYVGRVTILLLPRYDMISSMT